MAMKTAGQRNQRIQLQPWTGTNVNGVVTKTWGASVNRWAAVESVGGSEQATAGNGLIAEATHTFTVPRPTTVDLRDRLIWAARFWDIVFIDESSIDEIVIHAKAGQRTGN